MNVGAKLSSGGRARRSRTRARRRAAHADRAAEELDRPRAQHAPDPARQRPPARVLQPRLRPQRGERDEGDAQHGRRRPPEQPLGRSGRPERCTSPWRGGEDDVTARLERLLEGGEPERPLQPRGDAPVVADDEQPRLGRQVELLSGSRRPLLRVVVLVDLLVDELDLVAVLAPSSAGRRRPPGRRRATGRAAAWRTAARPASCRPRRRTTSRACRRAARACRSRRRRRRRRPSVSVSTFGGALADPGDAVGGLARSP